MDGYIQPRLIVLALVLTALSTPSEASRLVTHELQSNALAGNRMGIASVRRITVHIPDDYDRNDRRMAVVYFLPGFGGSGSRLVQAGLVAALDMANRRAVLTVLLDYTEGIVLLNSSDFGRWADFLIDEVIPFIDREYRTVTAPDGRALVGASMGGLSAVILSMQRPGVWGSIGLNDGAAYYAGYYEMHAGREGQLPGALLGDFRKVMDAWKSMPITLDGYAALTGEARWLVQLGLAISPNPTSPLHFDPPIDRSGAPVPAVLEKWLQISPFNPATIARQRPAFAQLSRIVLVVPEFDGATTNSFQNVHWMNLMTAAGIPVTRIDMPGGHSDFAVERLVVLEEALFPR